MAGDNLLHPADHHGLHVFVKAAYRAVDIGSFGDHVICGARVDLRDRDDKVILRIVVAADDGLQRRCNATGGNDRIAGQMRCGTMSAHACDVDVKFIDRRHHRAGGRIKAALVKSRRIVKRIDLADVEPVQNAFLDHHLGPAAGFFGGLKNQRHAAREIARFRQIFRRA